MTGLNRGTVRPPTGCRLPVPVARLAGWPWPGRPGRSATIALSWLKSVFHRPSTDDDDDDDDDAAGGGGGDADADDHDHDHYDGDDGDDGDDDAYYYYYYWRWQR